MAMSVAMSDFSEPLLSDSIPKKRIPKWALKAGGAISVALAVAYFDAPPASPSGALSLVAEAAPSREVHDVMWPLMVVTGVVLVVAALLTGIALIQRRNQPHILWEEAPPKALRVTGSVDKRLNGVYTLNEKKSKDGKETKYTWEFMYKEASISSSNSKQNAEIYVIKLVIGVWTIDKIGDGKVSAQSVRLARGRFPHEAPMIWMGIRYEDEEDKKKVECLKLERNMKVTVVPELVVKTSGTTNTGSSGTTNTGSSGTTNTGSSNAGANKGTLPTSVTSSNLTRSATIIADTRTEAQRDEEEGLPPQWPQDISPRGHPALTVALTAIAMLVGVPVLVIWYATVSKAAMAVDVANNRSAFAILEGPSASNETAALAGPRQLVDCGCVLIDRLKVVLPTPMIGVWSILITFGWSFLSALKHHWVPDVGHAIKRFQKRLVRKGFRAILPACLQGAHQQHDDSDGEETTGNLQGEESPPENLGEIAWDSMRKPSMLIILLGLLVQLYHLGYLLYTMYYRTDTWYVYYETVATDMVNSGGTFFWVSCVLTSFLSLSYVDNDLLGFSLKEPYVHPANPAGLRIYVVIILVCLHLPAIITHVFRAMIRWYWLAIPLEIFFALLVEAFFPEAMDTALRQIGDWKHLVAKARNRHFSERVHDSFHMTVTFLLFPLHETVAFVVQRWGLLQPASIAGPGVRVAVAAALSLMKAFSIQYFFDLSVMKDSGFGNYDCITMAYSARRFGCTECLAQQNVRDSYAVEAINQLVSCIR